MARRTENRVCAECGRSDNLAYHVVGVGWWHRDCYWQERQRAIERARAERKRAERRTS